MDQWPKYVSDAFEEVGYENYSENVVSFAKRWGGLDVETFVHVLKEGRGEDVVLAIFAVSSARGSAARELLHPFLESSQSMERWASALCLGKMREERALPVLLSMLTEFFPPKERPTFEGNDLWFYNGCRLEAILIIAEWTRPEVTPPLLKALQAFWQLEQLMPEKGVVAIRYWRECQNRIVYALGWLERFEALNGLEVDVAQSLSESWKVYLALGYLHIHTRYPQVFSSSWRSLPGVREQVVEVLKEQLGLSEEEQKRCLDAYLFNWLYLGTKIVIRQS